jgi:hypothetical protein
MDALATPDQFSLCVNRLTLLCDAGAIPPHTANWAANDLGLKAWEAARRIDTK